MSPSIGVLAYGSLISDPGCELEDAEVARHSDVETPFLIEFARKSRSRDEAPTLIPVERGGARVSATVIELRKDINLEQARNIVYRREVHDVCNRQRTYEHVPPTQTNVSVKTIDGFADLDRVLYTQILSNIDDVSPEHLAELAIESARGAAGDERRDGITYLRQALSHGIETPLSGPYRKAILRKTGTDNLREARAAARTGS